MRIDRLAMVAWLALAMAHGTARAQIEVNALTEVSKIDFRLEPGRAVPESDLRGVIVLKGRSNADAITSFFSWLPFVTRPEPRIFSPVELQRDLARIRAAYAASGYPEADAHYEVTKDDRKNRVAITFVVNAGTPLRFAEFQVTPADSAPPLDISEEKDRRDWDRLMGRTRRFVGAPAERARITRLEQVIATYFRERGYPWVVARSDVAVDSVQHEVFVNVRVNTGAEARIGEVKIEGTTSVTPGTIARELPFHTGDRYRESALTEGKREAQSLDIVRLALVDLPPQPQDSTVDVRVRISESDLRLVSGDLGYVSDAGITSEARWAHRNLNGRATTLTVTGVAQTGWLALVDQPDIRYRAAVTLGRPYLFSRRWSLLGTPYVEYRDDQQDRSTQYGVDITLLRQLAPLRSVALEYGISKRYVYEYRFGDFTNGDVDFLTFLQQRAQAALDSLGSGLDRSAVKLTSTTGQLDDPTRPRRGRVLRSGIQVTTPSGWNSTEFTRIDLGAWGYVPVGRRVTLAGRVGLGRLFPFGKSIPQSGEDPAVKFLQVKDVAFTAGGTNDVRGWGNRLLGPKFPDARVHINGTDTTYTADGYVAVGGLERVSGSVELQLPFPLLGSNFGSHLFLDGGRVWTSDDRFRHGFDIDEQERWFWASGAGVDLGTPVGPIRFSIGYKLNPSLEDLVDSEDLIRAIVAGEDINTLHRKGSRRFAYHLSIGAGW
jgi:outer membrane protein assembly factor BamA